MKKYVFYTMLAFSILISAETIQIENPNVNITLQSGVALEKTQQNILATQREILATNLKSLQLQIAEYRNRIDQSATYSGGYSDVARDIKDYKKKIEEINKKLGNNILNIDKMAETMKKRFGKDNANLSSTDLIKDELEMQKQSIQRLYLRLAQIDEEIKADFKLYNGESFAQKLDATDNQVKAMKLMAETMGGIHRSIHNLTEVIIEKSLKEDIDKMYQLEHLKKLEKQRIVEKAKTEYIANKYHERLKQFADITLTKEEKKERDILANMHKREILEAAKAAGVRLNETGILKFDDGTKLDGEGLLGNKPLDSKSVFDNIKAIESDSKLANDLAKTSAAFDSDGNFNEGKIKSSLEKLFEDGKSLLEGGVYSISFSPDGVGGNLFDTFKNITDKFSEYAKNPEKLAKDMGDLGKKYLNKTLQKAKSRALSEARKGLNKAKNFVKGQLNKVKSQIAGEINKIVDLPKQQIAEINKNLRAAGIDIDVSKYTNTVLDIPTDATKNILDTVDNFYNEGTNTAIDFIGNTTDDVFNSVTSGIDNTIDDILSGE